jgi:hypothetical protein
VAPLTPTSPVAPDSCGRAAADLGSARQSPKKLKKPPPFQDLRLEKPPPFQDFLLAGGKDIVGRRVMKPPWGWLLSTATNSVR